MYERHADEDFSYNVPVRKAGIYTLMIKFSEVSLLRVVK